jgi:hypothetical protein
MSPNFSQVLTGKSVARIFRVSRQHMSNVTYPYHTNMADSAFLDTIRQAREKWRNRRSSQNALDPNSISGFEGTTGRLYVKTLLLKPTEKIILLLKRLPTKEWFDLAAKCFVVVVEVMRGAEVPEGFVLRQGVSNEPMGESVKEAMKLGEKQGRVKKLLSDDTTAIVEKASKEQRAEFYGTEMFFNEKMKKRKWGDSVKKGFGCHKPWPLKILTNGKCVENRQMSYKSHITQLASENYDDQYCYFFIQETKQTDPAYRKKRRCSGLDSRK